MYLQKLRYFRLELCPGLPTGDTFASASRSRCQQHSSSSSSTVEFVSAEAVNTFKNRLDKFWSDQEVLCDYKTDLQGIGNRNIV